MSDGLIIDKVYKYGVTQNEIRDAVYNCKFRTSLISGKAEYCEGTGFSLCKEIMMTNRCKVVVELINKHKPINMTNKQLINTLKSCSCYECSYGCDSPLYCTCPECEYKDAHITIINKLEKEDNNE